MEWILDSQIWISLITLTVLEIVLGIDNLVFISILADKLPGEQRNSARQVGLGLALITRIALLLSLTWLIQLTDPLFTVFDFEFSGRDLILLLGGLFLIWKSTHEIHGKLEGEHGNKSKKVNLKFSDVIIQILLLDVVFSFDSVITAVGMVDSVGVMIAAVLIAVVIMIFLINPINAFVNDHPTVKMLALSFLLLIGFSLVAEGFGQEIPKGYIYFAMGFSVFVEMLNLRSDSKKTKPIVLRSSYTEENIE